MANDQLVYSTGDGDRRRRESAPKPGNDTRFPSDGVVRVFREKGGRGGKTVTVIRGLSGDLTSIASDLKRLCGSGGSVKDGTIEIQGDHRTKVIERLEAAGHRVKAAGG